MINIKAPHICLPNNNFQPQSKPNQFINNKILHHHNFIRKKSSALGKKKVQKINLAFEKAKTLKQIILSERAKSSKAQYVVSSQCKKSSKKEDLSLTKNSSVHKHVVSQSICISRNTMNNFSERNSKTSKWKNSILRRKNNGSQGKIITGLSAKRHSVLLEKAKVIIGQEQSPQDVQQQYYYEESDEKFEPIGQIKQSHQQQNCRYEIGKLKIKMKRKTMNYPSANKEELKQYRLKTEVPQQATQRSHEYSSRIHYNGGSYLKNLKTQLEKYPKRLAPWSMNSFA